MSMSCFDCHDYMDGYNRGKKEGAIEELEKTKSEIHDMLISDEVKNDYWGNLIYNKAYLFVNVIDKHIEELKQEKQ